MMNIFSIFPSTSMNLSMNWISMFIILLLLPYQFWLISSSITLYELK